MLTLGSAKEQLSHAAPAERLEFRIARATERLLLETRIVRRLALSAPYGKMALPPNYLTIEGVKINGVVRELANIYYEMLPGVDDLGGYSATELRDLGDQAIMADLPVDGTLIVAGTTDEVVKVKGETPAGLETELLFEGAESHANPFGTITRVSKDSITASASLTHTDADAVVTTLAILGKLDRDVVYRRYSIGVLSDLAENTVTALARVRFREFTSDDNILPIDNISALDNAMRALQFEFEGDAAATAQHFNRATYILEKEQSAHSGRAELPSFRIIHVGGSPKLTSHY